MRVSSEHNLFGSTENWRKYIVSIAHACFAGCASSRQRSTDELSRNSERQLDVEDWGNKHLVKAHEGSKRSVYSFRDI